MKRLFLLSMLLMPATLQAAQIMPPQSSDAREMTWQEEDGREASLASLRGKPVVLHFWAAWCTACAEELPSMLNWRQKMAGTEVVFISLDQRMAQARYFIDKHQLPMRPRLGGMSDLSSFGLRGLPATIFLDADGRETGRIVGAADWRDATLTGQVRDLLSHLNH